MMNKKSHLCNKEKTTTPPTTTSVSTTTTITTTIDNDNDNITKTKIENVTEELPPRCFNHLFDRVLPGPRGKENGLTICDLSYSSSTSNTYSSCCYY